MSPEYLAGVIDSDGSISITKRCHERENPNYSVMVQLGWVFKDETKAFMDKLVAKYGGSYKVIEPNAKSFSKRQHVKYCAFGNAAEALIKDIQPHLQLKTKQAANALRAREIVKSYNAPRPKECSEELENLWIENRKINDKNGY